MSTEDIIFTALCVIFLGASLIGLYYKNKEDKDKITKENLNHDTKAEKE